MPCPALSPWAALLAEDSLFRSTSCMMPLALAWSLGTVLTDDKIDSLGVCSSEHHFENRQQRSFSASLASYGFVQRC